MGCMLDGLEENKFAPTIKNGSAPPDKTAPTYIGEGDQCATDSARLCFSSLEDGCSTAKAAVATVGRPADSSCVKHAQGFS